MTEIIRTMAVSLKASLRVGQVTFKSSALTSFRNIVGLVISLKPKPVMRFGNDIIPKKNQEARGGKIALYS